MDDPLKQTVGEECGPPSVEKWIQLCRESSDAELIRLRLLALDCLSYDSGERERWTVYVGIAERSLRERGIFHRR
jgi:hypothetical protein